MLREKFKSAAISKDMSALEILIASLERQYLLNYFLNALVNKYLNVDREFIIKYLITKFPDFLAHRENTSAKRYPIIIFLSSDVNDKAMKARVGKFMIERSNLELRKAYFNFILDSAHPYNKFRHILTEGLQFADLLSMAKEKGFPILPKKAKKSCLHLLHETIMNFFSGKELIIYALEQSRYCEEEPMLKDLNYHWDADKLEDVLFLKEYGHELQISAAYGCHKPPYQKDGASKLEASIKCYLKEKLNINELAEIKRRMQMTEAIKGSELPNSALVTGTPNFYCGVNSPSFVFYNLSMPNDSLAEPFIPSFGKKS